MALPEYNRTVIRQVQQADLGSARAWETLANSLDSWSAQIGNHNRKQKANEVAAERAQVAADKLTSTNYVNSRESEILTELHKLSINNENDYTGYITAAHALRKTWLDSEGLDSIKGMREAFTTLIDKKTQEYGVGPYENEQAKLKAEGRTLATENLDASVTDAIFAGEAWINTHYVGNIDLDTHLDLYEEQSKKSINTYVEMIQKFDDLVDTHNFTAEEVVKLETEMTSKHLNGVMRGELKQQMKNSAGLKMIREFVQNPNKFIKDKPHLAALFVEGYHIDADSREDVSEKLYKFWTDTRKDNEVMEAEAEKQLNIEQENNFSDYIYLLGGAETINEEDILKARNRGDISPSQHDTLLDAMRSDKYRTEDEEMKMNIQQMLYNPNSKQRDIVQVLNSAFTNKDINWGTYTSFMNDVRSGNLSDVTTTPYFQTASSNLAARLHPQGPQVAYDTWVADAISFARRELYLRTLDGEQPIMIEDEIFERWNKSKKKTWDEVMNTEEASTEEVLVEIDTNVGFSLADSEIDPDTGWNTYWIGDAKKPSMLQTEMKIAKELDEGLIDETQAEDLLKEFRTYMKKHLGITK
jgi:hypothetical protein